MIKNDDDKFINLHDRPIREIKENFFDIDPHIVQRINNLISDSEIMPLSIALTGEWGSGKSSVINLLVNKLNQNKKDIMLFLSLFLREKSS